MPSQHLTTAASAGAATLPAAPGARYAFIHAEWHADIVLRARDGFITEMARHGVGPDQIDVLTVPGAFEIPLDAQRLAQARAHAAIVACALAVDGGIYRHEFVADAVLAALMRVQLDTGVPVFTAVLTPKSFHDHAEHQRFFCRALRVQGR